MKVHLNIMDEKTFQLVQEEVTYPHLLEVVFELDSGQRFRVSQGPKGDELRIVNPDRLQIVIVPEAYNLIAVTVREDETDSETGEGGKGQDRPGPPGLRVREGPRPGCRQVRHGEMREVREALRRDPRDRAEGEG